MPSHENRLFQPREVLAPDAQVSRDSQDSLEAHIDNNSKYRLGKEQRDLGFYVQVARFLPLFGNFPMPPHPKDFLDQESYQDAVGEHMERVWQTIDNLSDEKISFLIRWCGPSEPLREMCRNWDRYTPDEREAEVTKWRRLAGLNP